MMTSLLNWTANWLSIPSTSKPEKSVMQSLLFKALNAIEFGELVLVINHHEYGFGQPIKNFPKVVVYIHDTKTFHSIIKQGSLGVAESYIKGYWSTSQLTELCQLFLKNLKALQALNNSLGIVEKCHQQWQHLMNRNSEKGSKRNISAHYDLSNALFETFLDKTMMYSSGVFLETNDSLYQASVNKLNRVCDWLALSANDHVLEIGTGWGSMAIHAAQTTGCRVTTTTISKHQYQYTCQRVKALGLEDQITVLCQDYRTLTGAYEKIISIEMIEAVGKAYLPHFFQHCQRLLKPAGKLFIQAITMSDQQVVHYEKKVDFIQAYIFPGGYLPSDQKIKSLQQQETTWRLTQQLDIGMDYAKTLQHWFHNFENQLDTVKQLGFDQQFQNTWRYYLNYCEAGFLEHHIHCMQYLFEK